MELIIKPTGRCNFNCKFCSAHDLDILHPSNNCVHDKIKDLIYRIKPNRLIVTGGEPLMVNPEYYYNLHEISECEISITSNLKDFYINTDKWIDLFNENWFAVVTSFNYGNSRLWDKNTNYSEEMFINVVNKFNSVVNKKLNCFIAVIDYDNEDRVMDHVLLAKKLGMKVRINNALGIGLQDITYPRYKMYRHYIDIIDAGYASYEINCYERFVSKCPRNINFSCYENIRCTYVDNNGNLHVGMCDEQLSLGLELNDDEILKAKTLADHHKEFINENCIYCNLFRICNGCKTNRYLSSKDDKYCEEMKKLEKDLIRQGWLM